MSKENTNIDNVANSPTNSFVEVNLTEIDILNKKKQLIEQTQKVNEVNSANKLKINNLESEIDVLNEKLENILEIEQDVKTLIDSHKKTLQNPEKTAQNISKLEGEVTELQTRIDKVTNDCIENIDQYTEYLNRFL